MTDPLRQSPPGAVDASPTDPLTWASTRRTLLISGAIGVFLSFVGAFGTGGLPFFPRTAFMVVLAWAGACLGMLSFKLAARMRWTRGRRFLQGAVSATMMTPAMGLVVWGATQVLPSGGADVRELPAYVGISFIMCHVMTAVAVFTNKRAVAVAVGPSAPAPPRFLERLPLKLRGAEIWAVESDDHYLRLHTSKGQDLILLRLADAVAELEGIEGAQVHRSWWVARDAIIDAARSDGRATLTLKDGSEVPVSRTYAKLLREKRWI